MRASPVYQASEKHRLYRFFAKPQAVWIPQWRGLYGILCSEGWSTGKGDSSIFADTKIGTVTNGVVCEMQTDLYTSGRRR